MAEQKELIINAIFEGTVKVFGVRDKLEVVRGKAFKIEVVSELPPDFDIYYNRDPVLSATDDNVVTASELGASNIRFMSGITVIKDVQILVVKETSVIATSLGLSIGEPELK